MSAGSRRCALALHALHPHDREWMLGQLGSRAREDVRKLLAELVELGLPPDPSVVKQALAPHGVANGAETADPQAWATALSHEPVGLVAMAVLDLPGEQREAVLQRMGLVRERQVKQRLLEQRGSTARAARLKEAVALAVSERLQAAPTVRKASRWTRAWQRLRGARA
jgi:hypothetical protein